MKNIFLLIVLLPTFFYSQSTFSDDQDKSSETELKKIKYKYKESEFEPNYEIKIKRDKNVKLEVEYNPFATKLTIEKESVDLHPNSNIESNFLSLINQGTQLSKDGISDLNINSDTMIFISQNKGFQKSQLENKKLSIEQVRREIIYWLSNENITVNELKEKINNILQESDLNLSPSGASQWFSETNANITNLYKEKASILTTNEPKIKKGNIQVDDVNNTIKMYDNVILDFENLESLLRIISNTSDSKIETIKAEKDLTNVKLKFEKIDYYNENNNELVRETELVVKAKGGWKINTSVALILNNYSDNSKDFFVDENNVVGADDNNFFIPSIGTNINFYPYTGSNVNFGGQLGVSVPLQSEFNGLNFLLGAQVIFGNNNNVSLSSGLTYGPVQNLKNGLEIGDTFIGDSNNLTREVYDIGWFIGLSYNIFNIVE